MRISAEEERRAIERLIAQINEIGRQRDCTGRNVLWIFAMTFAAALCLLAWVALFAGPPSRVLRPDGPRAPAVLQKAPTAPAR
ncbi:MAG: hypothetical protein KatS3mg004_0469 [Bryobacteraceae bacterium]|nr:MAG: hypothetical protein KatS3mg004_0469 [Bryobacteraceae bacterium]